MPCLQAIVVVSYTLVIGKPYVHHHQIRKKRQKEIRFAFRAVCDYEDAYILYYFHSINKGNERCVMCEDFVICDLVTYDRWRIKADPACRRIIWNGRFDEDWGEYDDEDEDVTWNAAVLCAKDGCDHLYCHGGPFLVALVGSVRGRQMTFASVYSSATRKWSGMMSVKEPNVIEMTGHNAVVGNKVYFPCEQSDSVLEYDMGEQKLSVIRAPFAGLVGAEGGLLVFATVLKPRLHIWLMEVRVRPDRTTALARRRSIELAPKLSAYALLDVSVVGFAEGVGVIFLSTKAGLYTVELSSGRIKNMDREPSLRKIMPYMCFYTRALCGSTYLLHADCIVGPNGGGCRPLTKLLSQLLALQRYNQMASR
ncbi:hypothetical protein TRIUR3_15719 [Triticum urartu]|uniref:F-box associated domain-containing protein n=1 Tax=Triticum urartu TaxID=4572 RepID=M8A5D2_TRIUA|nr:hypothetical protein TRIUR3_15719 [Triticum urartu]